MGGRTASSCSSRPLWLNLSQCQPLSLSFLTLKTSMTTSILQSSWEKEMRQQKHMPIVGRLGADPQVSASCLLSQGSRNSPSWNILLATWFWANMQHVPYLEDPDSPVKKKRKFKLSN